jgi:hypothetical protein
MTNKKFISLIVISILLAISAAVSINMNTQNYNFQNRGEVFLKGFTQNINTLIVFQLSLLTIRLT